MKCKRKKAHSWRERESEREYGMGEIKKGHHLDMLARNSNQMFTMNKREQTTR